MSKLLKILAAHDCGDYPLLTEQELIECRALVSKWIAQGRIRIRKEPVTTPQVHRKRRDGAETIRLVRGRYS